MSASTETHSPNTLRLPSYILRKYKEIKENYLAIYRSFVNQQLPLVKSNGNIMLLHINYTGKAPIRSYGKLETEKICCFTEIIYQRLQEDHMVS